MTPWEMAACLHGADPQPSAAADEITEDDMERMGLWMGDE